MSSLALEGFGQHMLTTHVEISQRMVFSTHIELHYVSSLALWNLSRLVEIHFVSSLARDGFGQHKLRCILCSRCHEKALVNISRDTIPFFARMGGVEIHFVFSLEWEGFGQDKF